MTNEEHAKRMKAVYARLFYQELILQEDLDGSHCVSLKSAGVTSHKNSNDE